MKDLYKNKTLLYIGWLLGAAVIISGLVTLLTNIGANYSKDFYKGLLYVLAGLMVFPPFDKYLESKVVHKKIPAWVNGLSFIVLWFIAEFVI